MSLSSENKAKKLLEQVINLVEDKFPPTQAKQIKSFVQHFFSSITPEDILERDNVENLYGATVSYWKFASQYLPEQTKIQVYNPQFEQDGWQSAHTIVSILIKNMPFLVESIRMALNRQGLTVHLMLHPILKTQRDETGKLITISPTGNSESLIHLEVDRQTENHVLDQITTDLNQVLADVRIAVDDWPAMCDKMAEAFQELQTNPPPIDSNEINEVCDFLQWAKNDHFTFLGYREYELFGKDKTLVLKRIKNSSLGILKVDDSDNVSHGFAQLPFQLRELSQEPNLLLLNKTSSFATIHRPVRLDYIGIKRINSQGVAIGERRFFGLYTSSAYHQSTLEIPIIRQKVQYVLSHMSNNGHKNQTLFYILETYPRDELFQIDAETLRQTTLGIQQLQEQQRIRLFVYPDNYGRFFSCLVYIPRERYDTEIRKQMQTLLQEAFGGTHVDFNVRLTESVAAQIHFIVYTPTGTSTAFEIKEIEQQLVEVTRSWTDKLHTALIDHNGEEQGTYLSRRYASVFPIVYREDFSARHAIYDIDKIETLLAEVNNDISMSLYRPIETLDNSLHFKLFNPHAHIPLSLVLPMLENMGVQVIQERSYQVRIAKNVWIHDFELLHRESSLQIEQVKEDFQVLFSKIWRQEVSDDGFNRLVLYAKLNWRQIIIFRAYWKYLRQAGANFTQEYVEQALINNPKITYLLLNLFNARCNPATNDNSSDIVQQIEKSLDSIVSLDEDRILRQFLQVILATLRTNYFQSNHYLSFKFDPHKVPDLPEPRPMFEIFVYSPRVEGVHLRGGKVARGGLRWSDRLEDFRTEILGLVKAQMVKNAVIVPMGSKGGFIAKKLPTERDAAQAEGIECYKTFIRGLLDITDNIVDGKIIPPKNVVRHDDDDPYLVVAADKGTATFSDIANEISKQYNFWLGDAFASGGSSGYDHKKMAITARGGWESVKRHFRELGRDIQQQDFTVVGIGDMAGDVFGNGMLLSKHIKLLAAFNHAHIFLDPTPDSEISWTERERLFNLPRSSWADYDTKLLSEGGGIFSRNRKSIPLSPQIQAMLGIVAVALPPNELIRAILCTKVDLLWNGGIGTYVKTQKEHHIEVGDRANDNLRINGKDLRCKVVGEGGNLGLTQRGRIEYALNGGRINTDAFDNSGGVDCSDHEVNIKILLDTVVANGDMTCKQRDILLHDMTDSVASLVLQNNYLQTQALSIGLSLAPSLLNVHIRLIRYLEQNGQLDRELEFLPTNKVLAERKSNQQGLNSPELCVLIAYSKITLYKDLLESDLPEDPYFQNVLTNYFPSQLSERFRTEISQHPLHREIIATISTNMVVNRASGVFIFLLNEETGQTSPDIVRAFMVAWEIFAMQSLWEEIEALDNQVNAQLQISMMIDARKQVERVSRWLLRHHHLDILKSIELLQPGVIELTEKLSSLTGDTDKKSLEIAVNHLVEAGVPEALAIKINSLPLLLSSLDIVEIANNTGIKLEHVAILYFRLGTEFNLGWLLNKISALPRDTRWTSLSRSALRDDLYRTHRKLTIVVLRTDAAEPETQINTWMKQKQACVTRCQQVLADINNIENPDLSVLSVALREIRNLL
ncbi:NAD-glutamate dehydrogenase [Candidatus Halobeggiatoa sp. HSG11]|nr:NAD-glutamate dehydrogenase [Candidatus Halobeggiatoa sp. HSG11]